MILFAWLALAILLGFSFFFSSAETSYFALNPVRLHRIRDTRPAAARRIERLLATPTQVLSSVLIGNTLVNIAAANVGYYIAERYLPGAGEPVAIGGITLLVLLFGEITPKRLAMLHTERLAIMYVGALERINRLCTGPRAVLDVLTRVFEKHFEARARSITEDEFRTAVDVGHEEGVLTRDESAMVDGIIRLETLRASDVMTPRVDLIGLDVDAPVEANIEAARRARRRFLPVYRRSLDQVTGFVDVLKFLRARPPDLEAATIPHFYVPDTTPLDSLLAMFQRQGLRLAVVIDEFGGTAGLVTRGDILEEIVQDVEKEYAGVAVRIEPQGPNRWLIDGAVSLEDVNRATDLELEAEGADRLAGWISAHVERLARAGDTVESQNCRATVMEVRRHSIRTVLLEKVEP